MSEIPKDLIYAVKEVMERHWTGFGFDAQEIALRLKIDVTIVQTIIDMLT
jgi:hypothetical protein